MPRPTLRSMLAAMLACAAPAAHATTYLYDSGQVDDGSRYQFSFAVDVAQGDFQMGDVHDFTSAIGVYSGGKRYYSGSLQPYVLDGSVRGDRATIHLAATSYLTGSSPLGGPPYSGKGPAYEFRGTVAAVPEPASWALMLGGFGLVGAGLRRRRAMRPA